MWRIYPGQRRQLARENTREGVWKRCKSGLRQGYGAGSTLHNPRPGTQALNNHAACVSGVASELPAYLHLRAPCWGLGAHVTSGSSPFWRRAAGGARAAFAAAPAALAARRRERQEGQRSATGDACKTARLDARFARRNGNRHGMDTNRVARPVRRFPPQKAVMLEPLAEGGQADISLPLWGAHLVRLHN